jgi:uncharacterized protein YfaA (DUF2138 family)
MPYSSALKKEALPAPEVLTEDNTLQAKYIFLNLQQFIPTYSFLRAGSFGADGWRM